MFAKIYPVLSNCCRIFVSGKESGWKNRVCFCFLCFLLGLTISVSLILVFSLSKVGVGQVTLILSFSLGLTISILAYILKSVRCMSIIFLLTCGMREGRNVLLAVGTSIVIFNNVKNILENLAVMAKSLVCNVDAKRSFANFLFGFYLDLIKSIYRFAKEAIFNPFQGFVSLSDNFKCKVTISDDKLQALLTKTKAQIQIVSANLSWWFDIVTFVGHIAFLIIGISIITVRSGLFLRKFLNKPKSHNMYITKSFLEYDERQRRQCAMCVLPLNKKEKKKYIQIPSRNTSQKQRLDMALFFLPILTNILIWSLITFLDFMLYWLILTIGQKLESLDSAEVPITISFSAHVRAASSIQNSELRVENKSERIKHSQFHLLEVKAEGIPTYNMDSKLGNQSSKLNLIYLNLWRPQERRPTSFTIVLFEPQCIPKPEISLSASWIPLIIIIAVLFLLGGISAFLIQIKLVVMASFYPEKQLERVRFLHKRILEERSQVTMTRTSQNHILRNILSQGSDGIRNSSCYGKVCCLTAQDWPRSRHEISVPQGQRVRAPGSLTPPSTLENFAENEKQ
ncbi:dendritic cell-specific transmembrane protein [Gastrophryne carolinensis]